MNIFTLEEFTGPDCRCWNLFLSNWAYQSHVQVSDTLSGMNFNACIITKTVENHDKYLSHACSLKQKIFRPGARWRYLLRQKCSSSVANPLKVVRGHRHWRNFSAPLFTCYSLLDNATLKSNTSFLSSKPNPKNACFPLPSSTLHTKYRDKSTTFSTVASLFPGITGEAGKSSPVLKYSNRTSHVAFNETILNLPVQILSDWSQSPNL